MTSFNDLPLVLLLLPLAALLTALLLTLMLPLLQHYALARPNARSSHRVPTPQGGGIAVTFVTIVLTAAALVWQPGFADTGSLFPILACAGLAALLGAVDDMRPIPVTPRLLMQALIVAIAIGSLPAELRIFPALPWWIERVLFFLAGVWFVNLVNFMDGIDWMTVAETVPLTGGLIVLGLAGAAPASAVLVAVVVCGAILGFAPFNRPVARLFLGDAGSLPIGLLCGWMLALLAGHGHLVAALLLPLYYLCDTSLTLVRRLWRRENFWESHRTHYYQRAMIAGLGNHAIVGRVFALNIALVVLALATVHWPFAAVKLAALALGFVIVGLTLRSFARRPG